MDCITYTPIGIVGSPVLEPLRPEEIRGAVARLALEPRFAEAASALEVGQHLWVIYHLHRVEPAGAIAPADLFTRRIAARPNPVGVTLVRVVAVQGAAITVVGLDAVDGTPIL